MRMAMARSAYWGCEHRCLGLRGVKKSWEQVMGQLERKVALSWTSGIGTLGKAGNAPLIEFLGLGHGLWVLDPVCCSGHLGKRRIPLPSVVWKVKCSLRTGRSLSQSSVKATRVDKAGVTYLFCLMVWWLRLIKVYWCIGITRNGRQWEDRVKYVALLFYYRCVRRWSHINSKAAKGTTSGQKQLFMSKSMRMYTIKFELIIALRLEL